MTYRGKMQNGVVVLEQAASIPEGTEVNVEPVIADDKATSENRPSLSEVLLKYAGKAQGLPPDASRNHDHYLYGTPKR